MLSGDRATVVGERGPLFEMLDVYRRHWARIDIVCPRVASIVEVRPFENVHLHPSPVGGLGLPAHISETAVELRRHRPLALVVSHDYGLFRNAAGARRVRHELGVPWVSEIHHVDGYPRRRVIDLPRLVATRYHVVRARTSAVAFRVVSRQVADLLVRWGVPPEKLLRLGSVYLDPRCFAPPAASSQRDIDVLFCGRLESEKGIDLLLETLAIVARDRPKLRAVVVGRGSRLERVASRPCVELIPWVESPSDLADLYRRARVFLCTSWSEGNPRVVAEALACGAAVVSVPVGRVPEWIRDRENGRLVGWDARELADAVGELLVDDELRRELGSRAPAAVRGMDRATVLAELARAYKSLAGGSPIPEPRR